jgi:hypothetical protein
MTMNKYAFIVMGTVSVSLYVQATTSPDSKLEMPPERRAKVLSIILRVQTPDRQLRALLAQAVYLPTSSVTVRGQGAARLPRTMSFGNSSDTNALYAQTMSEFKKPEQHKGGVDKVAEKKKFCCRAAGR